MTWIKRRPAFVMQPPNRSWRWAHRLVLLFAAGVVAGCSGRGAGQGSPQLLPGTGRAAQSAATTVGVTTTQPARGGFGTTATPAPAATASVWGAKPLPAATPAAASIPAATVMPPVAAAPSTVATATPVAAATIPASPSPTAREGSAEEAFIQRVAPLAQAAQADSGVPASFSIALAASETGWGISPLMQRYNSYHGISCSEPNEGLPCVSYGDGRWNQYSSPGSAFLWFGRWLRAHKEFAAAFEHTDDPLAFAHEVFRCYISCGAPFPQKMYDGMQKLIEDYDLRRFDAKQP